MAKRSLPKPQPDITTKTPIAISPAQLKGLQGVIWSVADLADLTKPGNSPAPSSVLRVIADKGMDLLEEITEGAGAADD
jgi:hypothetical protein